MFQSTLPTRGSDDQIRRRYKAAESFNPRSPRGGATVRTWEQRDAAQRFQSTLPTRGSDKALGFELPAAKRFNPRSPRGGATGLFRFMPLQNVVFQSTLPTRGSDPKRLIFLPIFCRFNPRSPRGGATHTDLLRMRRRTCFNPRSPRGGATRSWLFGCPAIPQFQSTLPTRGSDPTAAVSPPESPACFNPRSPRGGATIKQGAEAPEGVVSIHAPHEGERLARW